MTANADTLVRHIEIAFRDVPPGELTMHQAHIVKWADEHRLKAAAEQDHDERWTDITDETIERASKALYGADPKSWCYFLPAFLCWTIRHFLVSDSFICDQTIYALETHEKHEELRREQMLRFDALSLPQKRCACMFLRFMSCYPDHCDAEKAWCYLEGYWGQFCPGLTAN